MSRGENGDVYIFRFNWGREIEQGLGWWVQPLSLRLPPKELGTCGAHTCAGWTLALAADLHWQQVPGKFEKSNPSYNWIGSRWAIDHAPQEAWEVLVKMPSRPWGKNSVDRLLYLLDAGIRRSNNLFEW